MRLVIVLDCADPESLADFWVPALGYERRPFYPPYLRLIDPSGRWPNVLLQKVPESKTGKNRMHIDVQVEAMQPTLDRMLKLGATVVWEPHDDDGFYTAVLTDPQGNEFCVIVPPEGSRDHRELTAT